MNPTQSNSEMDYRDLARQREDGTWLGSCDWGDCDNEQAGWAYDPDPNMGWLAACDDCMTKAHRSGHHFMTFGDIDQFMST